MICSSISGCETAISDDWQIDDPDEGDTLQITSQTIIVDGKCTAEQNKFLDNNLGIFHKKSELLASGPISFRTNNNGFFAQQIPTPGSPGQYVVAIWDALNSCTRSYEGQVR